MELRSRHAIRSGMLMCSHRLVRRTGFGSVFSDVMLLHLSAFVQSVLLRSEPLPEGTPIVQGHNFENGRDIDAVMDAMLRSGFQATNMGEAVNVVNDMV